MLVAMFYLLATFTSLIEALTFLAFFTAVGLLILAAGDVALGFYFIRWRVRVQRRRVQLHHARMQAWSGLYYCEFDGVVFFPGTNIYQQPQNIAALLP